MLQSEVAEWSYYLGCVKGQEVYLESHTCDRYAETTSALTWRPILRDPAAYGFHPFACWRPHYDHFVGRALRFGRADGVVSAA